MSHWAADPLDVEEEDDDDDNDEVALAAALLAPPDELEDELAPLAPMDHVPAPLEDDDDDDAVWSDGWKSPAPELLDELPSDAVLDSFVSQPHKEAAQAMARRRGARTARPNTREEWVMEIPEKTRRPMDGAPWRCSTALSNGCAPHHAAKNCALQR